MKYPDTVYKTFNFEECFVFPQYDGIFFKYFVDYLCLFRNHFQSYFSISNETWNMKLIMGIWSIAKLMLKLKLMLKVETTKIHNLASVWFYLASNLSVSFNFRVRFTLRQITLRLQMNENNFRVVIYVSSFQFKS